jgi:hypothetical protein
VSHTPTTTVHQFASTLTEQEQDWRDYAANIMDCAFVSNRLRLLGPNHSPHCHAGSRFFTPTLLACALQVVDKRHLLWSARQPAAAGRTVTLMVSLTVVRAASSPSVRGSQGSTNSADHSSRLRAPSDLSLDVFEPRRDFSVASAPDKYVFRSSSLPVVYDCRDDTELSDGGIETLTCELRARA